MKPQFRRIPQPKPKWTNHHNKGILLAVAIIFLSVAAVEKQVEWKTQNDKRFQFLINKLRFYPSILTCQNFDQSWWRLSFVGGYRELWHAKEEKSESNFCIYIINKTINCIFVSLPKIYFWWFIPNCQQKSCDYLYIRSINRRPSPGGWRGVCVRGTGVIDKYLGIGEPLKALFRTKST